MTVFHLEPSPANAGEGDARAASEEEGGHLPGRPKPPSLSLASKGAPVPLPPSRERVGRVHVIGSGLAGLSAAVHLAAAGAEVHLSDAAPQAGGRCRSYYDRELGLTIDNGNHLVLAGNRHVHAYLRLIGAEDRLIGPATADFPWLDLATGERWTLRPNMGRVPWWLLSAGRRVPGTRPADYLALARLSGAAADATIADTMPTEGALWHRLLEPLFVSALNTPAREASALLAGAVVRGSLARGGKASRPRVAHPTLAHAFVDPALGYLAAHGAKVTPGRRLRAISFDHTRATRLDFADGTVDLAPTDEVVLATPAWVAVDLIPGLTVPTEHHAIVNAHFAMSPPPGSQLITGLVGGTAEWVFALPDRISVTVSAADRMLDMPRDAILNTLWLEAARTLELPGSPMPSARLLIEKRATFAATPAQDALRPPARTRWSNLFLAGDWTQTGLPATIEGACGSGATAAGLALAAMRHY